MDDLSFPALALKISTENDAYKYLEELRWDGEPVCPHCGSINKHYFLTPGNGTSRSTRTGAQSQRRLWKCRDCKKQFSVLMGTVLQGTKISIRTWVFVLFEMASSKNGIAAREIARKYNLTPRSAWHMTQRIREAMKGGSTAGLLSGMVIADETYIGGDRKNKHGFKKGPNKGGRGTPKTPVVSVISNETGEVRSEVVTSASGKSLGAVLRRTVDPAGSTLVTDQWDGYRHIGRVFAKHETVNHSKGEYVRDGFTTNKAENYFSQLKRSLDGTHHHVSPKHLHRYVGEFDFRATTCKSSDTDRFASLVSRTTGRRLTYDDLRGSNMGVNAR